MPRNVLPPRLWQHPNGYWYIAHSGKRHATRTKNKVEAEIALSEYKNSPPSAGHVPSNPSQKKDTRPHLWQDNNGIWFINANNENVSTGTRDREEAEEVFRTNFVVPDVIDEELVEGVLKERLRTARDRAKRRGSYCNLSMGDMWKLWERSGGKCELSGLPFDWRGLDLQERKSLPVKTDTKRVARRLSLDRINADDGYTFDNCRFVTNIVNYSLNTFGDEEVFDMCEGIVQTALANGKI